MIAFEKFVSAPFEVVERKGIGHPDTLADGISESISRELCNQYLEEFGQILHHNVDKVLIIAGKSQPEVRRRIRAHPSFGRSRRKGHQALQEITGRDIQPCSSISFSEDVEESEGLSGGT